MHAHDARSTAVPEGISRGLKPTTTHPMMPPAYVKTHLSNSALVELVIEGKASRIYLPTGP